MNMKSSTTIRAGIALALASFVLASGAMAQDNKLVNKERPKDDAASCEAMVWKQDFVGTYPWVSEACHTVIVVNGERWARFEGKFQGMNDNGSFDAEFVNRSDRELGSVTLMPEDGQLVRLDNEDVRFSDLERDQVLSFYVPEDAVGFSVDPVAPRAKLVKIVDASDEARFAAADDTPDAEPVELAQADVDVDADVDTDAGRDRDDAEMPNTAGPLPLIALGGLMSLFGGLGLTIRRRLSKRNS